MIDCYSDLYFDKIAREAFQLAEKIDLFAVVGFDYTSTDRVTMFDYVISRAKIRRAVGRPICADLEDALEFEFRERLYGWKYAHGLIDDECLF